MKWDLIKMEIRWYTIAYSKRLAKRKKDLEKNLLAKLKNLMAQAENARNNSQLRVDIYNIRARLKKITEQKVSAMVRSKVRWVEQGEKNTRYFLNLKKRHAEKQRILKLKLENGLEVDDPDSILKEQANFLKNLYTSNNDNVENPVCDVFFFFFFFFKNRSAMRTCGGLSVMANLESIKWKLSLQALL